MSWGPRYAGLAGFEGDPQKLADRVVATIDGAAAVLTVGETSYVGGSATLLEGALEAVGRHRERSEGRLVRLPGGALLVGELTVAEVLGGGFVDAVEGLAGLDVGPSSVLDLGDFVRPTWRDGRCVLLVQAGAGRLVPFEVRDQIPCCHDH